MSKNNGIRAKINVFNGDLVEKYGFRFTFDMETLQLNKERLPLDYCHDDNQVVGYCENFEITKDGVTCDAMFFARPDDPGNVANSVAFNLANGVPYEASGFWDLSESDCATAEEGESLEYNGRIFDGPCDVFTNAILRGVAVCPYGADRKTSFVALSGGPEKYKAFDRKAVCMALSATVVDRFTPQIAVDNPVDGSKIGQLNSNRKELAMNEEQKPVETNLSAGPDSLGLQKYVDEFGKDRGVDFYLSGKTLDEVRAEDYAELKARRLELESREGAAADGDANADASINEAFEKLSAEVESLKRQVEVLTSVRLGDPVGVSENPVDQKTVATNPIQAYAEKHAKRNS